MLNNKWLKLSKYQQIYIIILSVFMGGVNLSRASEFNADVVMNEFSKEQRVNYMIGLVDGLAYARWQRDKPSNVGMKCIYDWYYKIGRAHV